MKTTLERIIVPTLVTGLLILLVASSAGAAEVWVRPTHFLPPGINLAWPTTGTGFVSFGFAVPDDMDSFVAARVALLPTATLAGNYDVSVEVKRAGEVVSAADLAFTVDNPMSLAEDELQEVEIGGLFSGLLDPNSPGNDYVSVFFWFPTGEPGADEGRVLGMRFVYNAVPLETASLADDAVTSAKVLDGSLTAQDIADGAGSGLDADYLDGLDAVAFAGAGHAHDGRYYTQTQLGSSGAGGAVHWDNLTNVPPGFADGVDDDTVFTAGPGLVVKGNEISLSSADSTRIPSQNQLTTLPSGGTATFTSVTIGSDGLGLISFHTLAGFDLRVAHCDDVPCTSATVSRLDAVGHTGHGTSVTIGADGLGLISYYDYDNSHLKVAHCNDVACTSAALTTLDVLGDNSARTSVAIGPDGLGLISYSDGTNDDLKVAHCNDVACTSATLTTLDAAGDVGYLNSLAIGSDGLGLVSYGDSTNWDLKVAHCDDVPCSSGTLATLDAVGLVGALSAVTVGSDGLGLISYTDFGNKDLKVAHCNDVACTGATLATIDAVGDTFSTTSVTIGTDGLGLISYWDYTNRDLKVAHCNDIACSTATLTALDTGGDVGSWSSLTIGTDGLGLVSYSDATNSRLKMAHCANALCVPFFRRR